MNVTVNSQPTTVNSPCSLTTLAAQFDLPLRGVAVAVNNRMIPRSDWDTFTLQENDDILIIKAAQGG